MKKKKWSAVLRVTYFLQFSYLFVIQYIFIYFIDFVASPWLRCVLGLVSSSPRRPPSQSAPLPGAARPGSGPHRFLGALPPRRVLLAAWCARPWFVRRSGQHRLATVSSRPRRPALGLFVTPGQSFTVLRGFGLRGSCPPPIIYLQKCSLGLSACPSAAPRLARLSLAGPRVGQSTAVRSPSSSPRWPFAWARRQGTRPCFRPPLASRHIGVVSSKV